MAPKKKGLTYICTSPLATQSLFSYLECFYEVAPKYGQM